MRKTVIIPIKRQEIIEEVNSVLSKDEWAEISKHQQRIDKEKQAEEQK